MDKLDDRNRRIVVGKYRVNALCIPQGKGLASVVVLRGEVSAFAASAGRRPRSRDAVGHDLIKVVPGLPRLI